MNWYLAKIVFRIICGEGNHTAQFDEQLRLINADTEDEAYFKAETLGKNEQDCFLNMKQQPVRWQFVNIAELYRISELIDGAELYSTIRETSDPDHYISNVHKKAAHIKEKETHQLLNLI